MKPSTNAATTLAFPEGVAQAPAVCLPAGEGLGAIGELAGELELVAEVTLVTRFVPDLPSVKGIRTDSKLG